ncbi:hypothetical protein WEN_01400 [Mycoplasma wenyonii str. Massachusetts]|uniref:Uncharacterized protein n=1 Tax=Mycoplasma wenyonii (strain Massachusetts) TaxID=1197325 RepID=I6ZIQ5_MYCWM|nr:hypothetical protein [Mycoplasma wenyonii]AFN65075.1 hypothetical protein WEN_01400 [Mycoplasma wenyonii str. Massachusetts]
MTAGLKILISSLGVVGVGGAVATPLTLWQTGYLTIEGSNSTVTTSSQESSSLASPVSSPREGNCVIVDEESVKDILTGLSKQENSYIAISCNKTGEKLNNWTGFFPSNMLVDEFTSGANISITTETLNADDVEGGLVGEANYRTTFKGYSFTEETVIGDWGDEVKTIGQKALTVVKVVKKDKECGPFYLLFNNQVSK